MLLKGRLVSGRIGFMCLRVAREFLEEFRIKAVDKLLRDFRNILANATTAVCQI